MQQFIATVPFDLYELCLFQMVARHQSFTKAAQKAGITQSALTRQIQGIEQKLGVPLLERTTRRVELTPAGELLFARSKELLQEAALLHADLQSAFALKTRPVRVGVSRSIALSYLPGFFFRAMKEQGGTRVQLRHEASRRLFELLQENEIDVAVCGEPPKLPRQLEAIHSFADQFAIIAPAALPLPLRKSAPAREVVKRLAGQPWLLLSHESSTGAAVQKWLSQVSPGAEPAMELDSFDLIINLVELGMGVSIVPQRALAPYLRRKRVHKIQLCPPLGRRVVVLTRRSTRKPPHVSQFVQGILFGKGTFTNQQGG